MEGIAEPMHGAVDLPIEHVERPKTADDLARLRNVPCWNRLSNRCDTTLDDPRARRQIMEARVTVPATNGREQQGDHQRVNRRHDPRRLRIREFYDFADGWVLYHNPKTLTADERHVQRRADDDLPDASRLPSKRSPSTLSATRRPLSISSAW
jgi:hypothetical protein